MFAVLVVVFVCRLLLPRLLLVNGYMSQRTGRRKKGKALAPATWSWRPRSTVVQRSDRDLTSPISTTAGTLLVLHTYPHPPQPSPVIVRLSPPPIAFSGCTVMAARRPISIESSRAKMPLQSYVHLPRYVQTGYQPGMLHGGCRCQIQSASAASSSAREICLLEILIDVPTILPSDGQHVRLPALPCFM
jgi:hypothetical protein